MARNDRQNKILELISSKDIDTQSGLVSELKKQKFNVTQATVSRDIKDLGLIKTLSKDGNKYKYTYVDSDSNTGVSSKFGDIYKESIVKVQPVKNLVLIKTIKGMASAVANYVDRLGLENSMGTVNGTDTVMVICQDDDFALLTYEEVVKSI